MRTASGQSTVEYILLTTVVVAIVVAVVVNNGLFAKAINKTLNLPKSMISESNKNIKFKRAQ